MASVVTGQTVFVCSTTTSAFVGGQVFLTSGVAALPLDAKARVLIKAEHDDQRGHRSSG
jgi:hypothetical protein